MAVLRNIILIVLTIYVVGMLLIWWRLREVFPDGEALWHSAFLSVSSFNNAGFSILPDANSLENFFFNAPLLVFSGALIILGGIGWTTLVDVIRHRRASRLTLDTKMVVTASVFLWTLGALVLFIAEYRQTAVRFLGATEKLSVHISLRERQDGGTYDHRLWREYRAYQALLPLSHVRRRGRRIVGRGHQGGHLRGNHRRRHLLRQGAGPRPRPSAGRSPTSRCTGRSR